MSTEQSSISFGVIADSQSHFEMQIDLLIEAGAKFVSYLTAENEVDLIIKKRYPNAEKVSSLREILDNKQIQIVVGACYPSKQAKIGIEVMENDKDFFSDRPGFVNLDEMEAVNKVRSQTDRAFVVFCGERSQSRATIKARAQIEQGEIGRVVQIHCTGPHRSNLDKRPDWFFKKEQTGGILTFIGCHQFEQLLYLTDYPDLEVEYSQVANYHHNQYPEFEDFGEAIVTGGDFTAHINVDWFTPRGLGTFGDSRIVITGTTGFIEVRKFIDVQGKPGGDHIFLVNDSGSYYINCKNQYLLYGQELLSALQDKKARDILWERSYKAAKLYLTAQEKAYKR